MVGSGLNVPRVSDLKTRAVKSPPNNSCCSVTGPQFLLLEQGDNVVPSSRGSVPFSEALHLRAWRRADVSPFVVAYDPAVAVLQHLYVAIWYTNHIS